MCHSVELLSFGWIGKDDLSELLSVDLLAILSEYVLCTKRSTDLFLQFYISCHHLMVNLVRINDVELIKSLENSRKGRFAARNTPCETNDTELRPAVHEEESKGVYENATHEIEASHVNCIVVHHLKENYADKSAEVEHTAILVPSDFRTESGFPKSNDEIEDVHEQRHKDEPQNVEYYVHFDFN